MQKLIRQAGNSKFIRLDKEDCLIHDLEAGDVVDIEIVKIKDGLDGTDF